MKTRTARYDGKMQTRREKNDCLVLESEHCAREATSAVRRKEEKAWGKQVKSYLDMFIIIKGLGSGKGKPY